LHRKTILGPVDNHYQNMSLSFCFFAPKTKQNTNYAFCTSPNRQNEYRIAEKVGIEVYNTIWLYESSRRLA